MHIKIAQFTFATPDVQKMKDFYSSSLGSSAELEDHKFFFTFNDREKGGCIAVVPHNGDKMWDKPWLTLSTDDLPVAIEHMKKAGATDIQNSGPTDDNGQPIACVTMRDPEGRLIMLAIEG
ncbi:MAG: VOC family protein [Planctomycetota bacterium]|nr:VOC family protein [Planctomycetota bacterium]